MLFYWSLSFILQCNLLFAACECITQGEKEGSNGECNADGECSCKDNVEGAKCSECSAGYEEFPDCDQCVADHYRNNEDKCVGKCHCNVLNEQIVWLYFQHPCQIL